MVVELSIRRWVLPTLSQASNAGLADQFEPFLSRAERRASNPKGAAATPRRARSEARRGSPIRLD
jgi:hypothetical protein